MNIPKLFLRDEDYYLEIKKKLISDLTEKEINFCLYYIDKQNIIPDIINSVKAKYLRELRERKINKILND